MQEKKFGIMTTLSMIIGICIGSGIFFKADDVLLATQGSVIKGVIVFIIGAISIIFGSLTLSVLAEKSKDNNGIVSYFEQFVSKKSACGFAWFQYFLYLPALNIVVAWVAAIYTLIFFQIDGELELQIIIAAIYLVGFYILNYFSIRLGAAFQRISMYIKLVPLILVAGIGLFVLGDESVPNRLVSNPPQSNLIWLAALTPIAFSYDGWTVVLNFTKNIKNPKKNVSLALAIAPIFILLVYLSYFLGITSILGVDQVIGLGDQAIYVLGEQFLGKYGGKIITFVILISILGVNNGLIIASLSTGMYLENKQFVPKINKNIKKSTLLISLLIIIFWLGIHYLVQKFQMLGTGDISELAITFSYLMYVVLYIRVIKIMDIKKNFMRALVCPILATLGSSLILTGSLLGNLVGTLLFIGLCSIVYSIGVIYFFKFGNTYRDNNF